MPYKRNMSIQRFLKKKETRKTEKIFNYPEAQKKLTRNLLLV